MVTQLQKKRMIKLIHTQKTRAGIDDEAYCCILMGAANVQSTLDIETLSQFSSVINTLNKLLIAQGQAPLGRTSQPIPRDVYPLVKRAERILGVNANMRLSGFIRKLGKNSVNDLSPLEIRKCHGFLSHIEHQSGM